MRPTTIITILFLSLLVVSCAKITSFEECVVAGYPVMESYPRKCSAQGQLFIENVSITGNVTAPESENISVPDRNSGRDLCQPSERGLVACTKEYQPVCGWFNKSIQCIKYPCAADYSNRCTACADEQVEYVTAGTCPQ